MQTACVVSDLHMFSNRSEWEQHLDEMHTEADRVDLFVFNGDTFDFKWSTLGSRRETIDAAIAFLQDFALAHPDTRIHVNLGNHDHDDRLMAALETLAAETANLSWHPYFLRVGNTLFLHGDAATFKMTHHRLKRYRENFKKHKRQEPWRHNVYDALVKAKAHVVVSKLAFPHKVTMKRVAAYLDDIGHGIDSGLEQVYFGHTHVIVDGQTYKGVTFHNGGAPMSGTEFSLLRAELR